VAHLGFRTVYVGFQTQYATIYDPLLEIKRLSTRHNLQTLLQMLFLEQYLFKTFVQKDIDQRIIRCFSKLIKFQ
jgi:hypothetical protein